MLLEAIGVTCFTLLATALSGQTNADGLELPADPAGQARVLGSHCLMQLKERLVGARVLRVQPDQVELTGGTLGSQEGELVWTPPAAPAQVLARLGPEGGVHFARSGEALELRICARAGEQARHEVTLRLPVSYAL